MARRLADGSSENSQVYSHRYPTEILKKIAISDFRKNEIFGSSSSEERSWNLVGGKVIVAASWTCRVID